MQKLLATGRTDLLKGFISNKTRRKFSAYLVRDPKTGKVGFEFEPRAPKAGAKPAAKADEAKPAKAASGAAKAAVGAGDTAKKPVAKKPAAKKPAAKKPAVKPAAKKPPQKRKPDDCDGAAHPRRSRLLVPAAGPPRSRRLPPRMVPQGRRLRCRDPRALRRGCRRGIDGTALDTGSDESLLARILLLDQFTRNIFRGTPRAFAGDTQALKLAETLVAAGRDKNLSPWQRWFAYLPFEHSESSSTRSARAALFAGLRREMRHEAFDSAYDYALRHREVIARFGRFPHRNAILGRKSTAEEIEFLKQPGLVVLTSGAVCAPGS
jgi:uncharacterized protein (DUF924 family)